MRRPRVTVRPVRISVLLRLVPEALDQGRLAGEAELVATGEQRLVATAEELVAFVRDSVGAEGRAVG